LDIVYGASFPTFDLSGEWRIFRWPGGERSLLADEERVAVAAPFVVVAVVAMTVAVGKAQHI